MKLYEDFEEALKNSIVGVAVSGNPIWRRHNGMYIQMDIWMSKTHKASYCPAGVWKPLPDKVSMKDIDAVKSWEPV